MARGITASELPYDGAPPPTDPPSGKEAAGTKAMALPNPGSDPALPDAAFRPELEPEPDALSAPPASLAKPDPQSAKPQDTAVPTERKLTNTGRTQSTQPNPARNREIERIKRQADDELTQKNRSKGAVSAKPSSPSGRKGNQQVAAASAVPRVKDMRTMLMRCEQSSNFIRREQCKWRLCSGMWGKNGCPSYSAQAGPY